MPNEMDDYISHAADSFLYKLFCDVCKRYFPEDSIVFPLITLSHKYGMPVRNLIPFIQELGDWCSKHLPADNNNVMSDTDRQSLSDLLSRSGFMTIGFSQEGDDPDGNG